MSLGITSGDPNVSSEWLCIFGQAVSDGWVGSEMLAGMWTLLNVYMSLHKE